MSTADVGVLQAFLLGCRVHNVKHPNPLLLKFFQEVEPVASSVESISLTGNYVGNRGILAVLDVAPLLPRLQTLDLSNQKLYNADLSESSVKGNAVVDRLIEVFEAHPSLTALDVSKNPISNYAGRKILSLCKLNHSMCRVSLDGTRIDFDLRKRIAAQCEKNAAALWEKRNTGDEPEDMAFGERQWELPTEKAPDLSMLGAARVPRTTICAEGIDPEKARNFIPPFYEKSEGDMQMIVSLLNHNVLFSFLTTKDLHTVAGAMELKTFNLGDEIMRVGDTGNGLYVIQTGNCDIIREGQKVYVKTPGTAVGELELMYMHPCIATVRVATETCVTWCLDRDTYRNLVMGTAIRRREQFCNYIQSVPFLSTLDHYEKMQIADALSENEFAPGEYIICFDEEGEWMYIVLEGTVEVIGRAEGEPTHVCDFSEGDFFGELEFLNRHRTVADVVAKTAVHTAKLNRRHFEMCMGPIVDLLKRNTAHPKYDYYRSVLARISPQPQPV